MQRIKKARVIAVALALTTIIAFVLPAVGQEKAEEKMMGPFTGTVVDAADKPVAGATVWLVTGKRLEDPHVVSQMTTDDQGRFLFQGTKISVSLEGNSYATLMARDSQKRIGGQIRHFGQIASEAMASEIKIRLEDMRDYRVRLTDAAGQPIPNATIRPTSATGMRGVTGYFQNLAFPAEWDKEITVNTDSDGSVTISNLPTNGTVFLGIRAEGFGKLIARADLEKTKTIQLAPPAGLRGTLTCDVTPEAVAGVKIHLYSSSTRDSEVFSSQDGLTRTDGTFTFENIQSGTCRIQPELPSELPYYVDGLEPVEVKAGETATASLVLKPAVRLQGKIVDGQTGEGVAGVRVSLYYQDQKGSGGRQTPATTDEKGEFTFFARPGKAQISLWQFPELYVNPMMGQQPRIVDVKESTTLKPIRLERASVLEGIVVDKSGKPVADAEIHFNALAMGSDLPPSDNIRSDAAGKFFLKKMPPKQKLSVRARTKTAAAEPVNVTVGESEGPIRLVADDKTDFTLRGTVVDEVGQPLPKADVQLTIHLWFGNWGTSFGGTPCTTDTEGKFEFGGLWPGDRYQIMISMKDREKFASPNIESKASDTHDFGKITLLSASGAVEGAVVDGEDKLLSGVRVFNKGDGPKPIETVSDESGHFRLQGFRSGPVIVFAEKEGLRFTGLWTKAGATDVVLKMLRIGEPLPPCRAASTTARSEAERTSARTLLERFQKSDDDRMKQWAQSRLAKLESQEAREKGTDNKPQKPRERSVYEIAVDDLEEAMTVISKDERLACIACRNLANDFAKTDPEKAIQCATAGVIHARNLDQPDRTAWLARIGAILSRLGKKEDGKKLTHEAAEVAAKWQLSDRNRWSLREVAIDVAACDVDEGVALLQKFFKGDEYNNFLADLAGSIDDVDKAESLLKGLNSWNVDNARMRLAYRVAAKQPAEAVRLVEQMDPSGQNGQNKAKAFGWVAAAITPQNKELAHSLLDRAMVIYRKASEHAMYDNGPAQAAILALIAEKAGYPDMESMIYRALATRQTADANDSSGPARTQEANTMMALFIALLNPESAKSVLQSIEPQSDCIGSGYSGISRIEWFKAWALVDPQHTVELLDREWAANKDSTDANTKQITESGVQEAVELWLTAPGNRLKNVSERHRDMFPPTEED